MSILTIERKVLEKNDEVAARNRLLFRERKIAVINLVSSPGAGKTTLLEKTLERLKGEVRIAVVEGDVQTSLDAERVAAYGVPVAQIVTHGACHLDAPLVRDAVEDMPLEGVQLLVIENVGNLVCPAGYDLGEDMKVVVAGTTEGDDKPLKYPAMFRNSAVLVINKTDLLAHVDCDLNRLRGNALSINPKLKVFPLSARTGDGMGPWCTWLTELALRGAA
jgi:hydrogenase nickel incorporation protein HypB